MQLCFILIAIYSRRCQDVLPTGLTYMHTHCCRYSRNKIHKCKTDRHTYKYIHTNIRCVSRTCWSQVGAICDILTLSQTKSILDAWGSPRYKPADLVTKYITNHEKKKKKKNRSCPLLHLDNMYSDFIVYMLYCSRRSIISHFFLNFLSSF